MKIETKIEGRRGCGYRKGGGLYMISGKHAEDCHRLPVPLDICPTCRHGIKSTRGFTWIDASIILAPGCKYNETNIGQEHCIRCVICRPPLVGATSDPDLPAILSGLLWIGSAYYKTPASFNREAELLGISRKIAAVPRGFEIGKTWVFLAHRQGSGRYDADKNEVVYTAGIIGAFRPTAIEYVVKGDESDRELELISKRGITLVRVERAKENEDLFGGKE